jgi:hypothetical protein
LPLKWIEQEEFENLREFQKHEEWPSLMGKQISLIFPLFPHISAINSCWEKCDEKCAYMFNVYKNQRSRQTRSRNLTGPKTLPTIWYTYMTLVTKYQISAINSYWEKCDEKYLGTDGRTDRITEGWKDRPKEGKKKKKKEKKKKREKKKKNKQER